MSASFGEIRQLGVVVRDLDAALRYYTVTLGIGPFYVMRHVTPDDYTYRGEASPPPTLDIALGNSGDLQIELIAQVTAEPSAYKEFLDAGREGIHHVSSWLTRADFERVRAERIAAGDVIAQEGGSRDGGLRWAYFATDSSSGGIQYEIADILDAPMYGFFEHLAALAKGWDGSDPIRELRRG
jgi:catechol 2,3-dioxygenase-like lactoylglutathione lyase family enzyme